MKNKLLLASMALALPAFAGTPAGPAVAPAPAPSLWNWFIGGSVGYLSDAQEAMYNGHIGVDTPWNVGGWNVALFGEVGYAEIDDSYQAYSRYASTTATTTAVSGAFMAVNSETEIMPYTLNVKFERPIVDNLHVYAGGGLGFATVDISTSSNVVLANYSHNDTVFTAQLFAGLNYNFCPAFEMYGGARWIYMDDVKTGDVPFSFNNDDWLFELGARFNF